MATLRRLLQFSYSMKNASEALIAAVPTMRAGFIVNARACSMSVNGDDAQALADLLDERLRSSLGKRDAGRQGAAGFHAFDASGGIAEYKACFAPPLP